MEGTFWAFVPAIIAIVLALLSKQVYLSLFVGIFTGAMFLADGNPMQAFGELFTIMSNQLGGNGGILVFLVVLGIFSVLLIKTGGSKAYGDWASQKIKTKRGALLSTIALGSIIFVDDYFNCLTVGSVMRPVTDKYRVSRAKLAYIIDSTAAPICIIAPISSWAAAVSGFIDGDGLVVFIKTIPFNMYALLTIGMMLIFALAKMDIFKMGRNEKLAETTGDLHAGETDLPTEETSVKKDVNGKVWYLVLPIIVLILCCVGGMVYTGYCYDWEAETFTTVAQSDSFISAFANCNSGISLAIGSTIALIITMLLLVSTKAISFKECMGSITEGFKSMVPAILILTFAWTLSAIMGAKGGALDARAFVEANVSAEKFGAFIPAVMFLIACGISFATGTSWGTFGILIPIATSVVGTDQSALVLLTIAAVLGGAVYGDHVSPISDTTIMASSGAQCNHLDHVRTQLPYGTIVALISCVTYLIMGFVVQGNISYGAAAIVTIIVGAALLCGVCTGLFFLNKKGLLDNIKFTSKKRTAENALAAEVLATVENKEEI